MNNNLNIGILCNSRLGIPSMQALLHNRLVKAIAVPAVTHDALSDIHQIAGMYNLQPDVLPRIGFKAAIKSWIMNNSLDLVMVFTFPWKIPADVLSIPAHGFLNFHFGLLPEYRGADGIFHAIKHRESHGGISVHYMDEHFDTGPLLHIEKVPIAKTDTYGMLTSKLAAANVGVLEQLIPKLFSGQQLITTEQNEQKAGYYKRPSAQDVSINWYEQNAYEIQALINACNPWNKGAYTSLNGMIVRIIEATACDDIYEGNAPGQIIATSPEGLSVMCIKNTSLMIKTVCVEEGIYSADTYAHIYGIKNSTQFSNINTLQTA